jgi:F0F1-type ATP synthase membrane subunit b/b'
MLFPGATSGASNALGGTTQSNSQTANPISSGNLFGTSQPANSLLGTTQSTPFTLGQPAAAAAPATSTQLTAAPTAEQKLQSGMLQMNLEGLTIEQIIYKWNQCIQSHVDRFQDVSGRVRKRDLELLETQKAIMRLTKNGRVLKAAHDELSYELDSIFELYEDVETALEELEKNLSELEAQTRETTYGSSVGADEHAEQERKAAYELADELDMQMNQIESEVKRVVDNLNARVNLTKIPPSSATVLQMLNKQQSSLEWIDRETEELKRSLDQLQSIMQPVQSTTEIKDVTTSSSSGKGRLNW